MKNKPYSLVIIVSAIVIVAVLGVFWYFRNAGRNNMVEEKSERAETVDGATIQVETNPVKEIPDLNPAGNINPFKTKNPFE